MDTFKSLIGISGERESFRQVQQVRMQPPKGSYERPFVKTYEVDFARSDIEYQLQLIEEDAEKWKAKGWTLLRMRTRNRPTTGIVMRPLPVRR